MKILIIGGGVAGASTAIFLIKQGFNVTLIDHKPILQSTTYFKTGESLPPNAKKLLQELEVWDDFGKSKHLKCFGNKSVWGSEKLVYKDFINHPIGYGWHIDRVGFEQMLLDKAQQIGAKILEEVKITSFHLMNTKWQTQLKTKDKSVSTKTFDFIVDATGRNSWFARRQGVDRLYEDIQLALVGFLSVQDDSIDSFSLIETNANGWWYSAKLPNQRLVTNFLCEPTKAQRQIWQTPQGWKNLVNGTIYTIQRLQKSKAKLIAQPQFIAADTSILEQTYGEQWLAVGDAAMTYDPIASHGMMMAIVSGRDAANAIAQHFSSQNKALKTYDTLLWTAFHAYLKQRKAFYRAERRFEESEYWKRRSF